MDYAKLIFDAAKELNSLVNKIYDMFDEAGTPINPGKIISDITAKAFPVENGVIQLDKGIPLTEEELEEFEKEDAEITKKMREQGIPDGRIYSHIKSKSKEPMATVPNEPVAKGHLAGETTPEEDALISQAIKNAVRGVM